MANSAPGLPAGVDGRPATHADLPAIDALFEASERSLGVRPSSRSGYLEWRWSQPYVDVASDTLAVIGDDGELAGFGMGFVEPAQPTTLQAMGRVHPRHAGRGIGRSLLAFFADRGHTRPGVTSVRLGIAESDRSGHALVAVGGYRRVRTSYDMGVELAGDETPVEAPAGITIRPFVSGDEEAVWRVEVESFRDHWDHEVDQPFDSFLSDRFADPVHPPRISIAETGGEPVGICAWFVDDGVPYVFSVAVLRPHRGRGVATALLRATMADAAAAGYREVTLSVDATNPTGALRVYEKVGMEVHRALATYERRIAGGG